MASILAIEFSELECKVVVADVGKSKPLITEVFRLALPKNDDPAQRVAERAKLLKEALQAHRVRTKRARIVVPKNYVMARMVTLPSINDDELAGMARFEAERHIPFNADRHIVSHHVLSKLGVEGSQVLLAAIDRPIAREYIDICSEAGLVVESLGVSSLAVFNAYAAVASETMTQKVVAIVNIGSTYTDLVIVSDGVLSFTRGTSVCTQRLIASLESSGRAASPTDLTTIDVLDTARAGVPANVASPEEATETEAIVLDALAEGEASGAPDPKSPVMTWLVQLLKEMRRTYEFARREFNCPPITEIRFTGEGSLLRNLDRFFQVNFGVEAQVFSPDSAFEFSSKLVSDARRLGATYVAALGALAPATSRSVTVNLVPPEYREAIEAKRRRQSYLTTGILAVIALFLAYLWVWDLFQRQNELLEAYKRKNREMKERVQDLESKKKKLEIIRRYIQDKHGALDIIERISSFDFIPERVTLTRFEYRKDEAVKIEGHAKTIADINRLEAELKKTGIFESVVQDQGSNKPIRLPNRPDPVLQYQMTCTFPKRTTKNEAKSETGVSSGKTTQEAADGTE